MEPDWNDDPPSPLSSQTPTRTASSELPEVRELLAAGWQLAPEAPLFAFLPAVWPADHRTWVLDRGTWYSEEYVDQGPAQIVPADPESIAMFHQDMAQLCAMCGVPPRPAGRIWLLRMPSGSTATLESVLTTIRRRAKAAGVPVSPSQEFARVAVETIADVFADSW